MDIKFLHCFDCGKSVSTGFYPVPTDTPDKGIIIRAVVICPECIDKNWNKKEIGRGSPSISLGNDT